MRRINNTHELLEKIKEKYIFIIVAILFSIITIYVHSKSGALTGVDIIPFGERVIHVVLVYVKYLQKFVYPFELSIVYPYQLEDKWLRLVIAILLLALITIAALKAAKRFPYILFGWSWFVVMLFPLTGLIQSGRHDHADRYMYFPIIGLLIASIFLILNSMSKLKVSPFIVRTFLVMIITVLAIVATITVTPWKNTYTIFFNALLHTDNNYIAHGNLAINFLDDGDIEKGMFHYEKSRSIIPKHVNLYDGMSHKLVSIKEYDLALTVLNDAIESGIENGEIYRKIGQIELLNENYHNSIENFRKAKLFNPNLSGVSYGLAYSYYSLGNYGSALDYLLLELKIDPDNDYAKRLYVDICKKIPDSKNCDKYKQ